MVWWGISRRKSTCCN